MFEPPVLLWDSPDYLVTVAKDQILIWFTVVNQWQLPVPKEETTPRNLCSLFLSATARCGPVVSGSEFEAESWTDCRRSLVTGCQVKACVFQVVIALQRKQKHSELVVNDSQTSGITCSFHFLHIYCTTDRHYTGYLWKALCLNGS